MGNSAYFITFKDGAKEDILEALSMIGEEGFSSFADIQGIATFKKSFGPANIKRGESYLMTYGCHSQHRDKLFLEDVDGIDEDDCRVILGENVYLEMPNSKTLSDYADIESFDWDESERECCCSISGWKLEQDILYELRKRPLKVNLEFAEEDLKEIISNILSAKELTLEEFEFYDHIEYLSDDVEEEDVRYDIEITYVDKKQEIYGINIELERVHAVYDFDSENLYGLFSLNKHSL